MGPEAEDGEPFSVRSSNSLRGALEILIIASRMVEAGGKSYKGEGLKGEGWDLIPVCEPSCKLEILILTFGMGEAD
jgi:hypothetical protein